MTKNEWLVQLSDKVSGELGSRSTGGFRPSSTRNVKAALADGSAWFWKCVASLESLGDFELWISRDDESQLWFGFSAKNRKEFKSIESAISAACGVEAEFEQDEDYKLDVPQSYEAAKNEWYCGLYPKISLRFDKNPSPTLVRRIAEFAISVADIRQRELSGDISDQDLRKKVLAEIHRRQGQPMFRQALLKAYNGKCAVSGCSTTDLLDAAHIIPYRGEHTNAVRNGLLLRTDIHRLFDLGLISIDPSTRAIGISDKLNGTIYEAYRGKKLEVQPFEDSLAWHIKHVVKF